MAWHWKPAIFIYNVAVATWTIPKASRGIAADVGLSLIQAAGQSKANFKIFVIRLIGF